MCDTKKAEKADLSEAEKTAVGKELIGQLIDDVITSDTTQPSVPGIVLDTINDIIMSEVALAKEEAAKEKEEKEKEEEKQKKEQERKRRKKIRRKRSNQLRLLPLNLQYRNPPLVRNPLQLTNLQNSLL